MYPQRTFAALAGFAGLTLATAQPLRAETYQVEPTRPLASTPEADARMTAFREAKYGMFIHWGTMSVLNYMEHMQAEKKISAKDYAPWAKKFNPTGCDVGEWVRLAKEAGMKYIVLTAKHHDGFCLWDSKVTDFDSIDASPVKRDFVAELAKACKEEGIKLGLYYSHAQDWHHEGGAVQRKDFHPHGGDFKTYLDTVSLPQVKELLTNYGDIFLIWYDTPTSMTPEIGKRFTDLMHATQPATLANSRLVFHGFQIPSLKAPQLQSLRDTKVDYLSYKDRSIPASAHWRDWETCMTISKNWNYIEKDTEVKSPKTIVTMLSTIASRGGNFLLNVGPDGQGHVRDTQQASLLKAGRWMKINGEAIYGADIAPFVQSGPEEKTKGHRDDPTPDWVMTAKTGVHYLHIIKWPKDGKLVLKGVTAHYAAARFLAAPDTPVTFTQDGDTLMVTLPASDTDPLVSVLKLTLKN